MNAGHIPLQDDPPEPERPTPPKPEPPALVVIGGPALADLLAAWFWDVLAALELTAYLVRRAWRRWRDQRSLWGRR